MCGGALRQKKVIMLELESLIVRAHKAVRAKLVVSSRTKAEQIMQLSYMFVGYDIPSVASRGRAAFLSQILSCTAMSTA